MANQSSDNRLKRNTDKDKNCITILDMIRNKC